jgi:hypothetical protein
MPTPSKFSKWRSGARRLRAKAYTLQSALDEYLGPRGVEHPRLRPASVALYRQLERLLKPWLNRNLNEITFDMIERKHQEIAKEIGKSTANLAMRVLRIVWSCAADQSLLPECPVARLKKALVRGTASDAERDVRAAT